MDDYNSFEHSTFENIVNYGFLKNKCKKALGQNFLYEETLLDKIARHAIPLRQETTIIEVGAGPCGLTRSLIKTFQNNKLVCIEKDIGFKPLHDNMAHYANHDLTFIYEDALKYDFNFEKFAIVANLPYNVGTILLAKWLTEDIKNIEKMVLLFQKEVAERICAKLGTKQYGSISVLSQLLCETDLLFDISNKAFIPSPKVTSSLVLLTPKKDCDKIKCIDLKEFAKFVSICFQFRRKMIYSTLRRLYPYTDIASLLSQFDIDKSQRPETISPQGYINLFENIK